MVNISVPEAVMDLGSNKATVGKKVIFVKTRADFYRVVLVNNLNIDDCIYCETLDAVEKAGDKQVFVKHGINISGLRRLGYKFS